MMYYKFLIGDSDRFDAANFPELQKGLDATTGLLAGEPDDPKAEMLLSFVKDHCMNSQLAINYPRLASLISTKEVPVGVMEDLFEASRKNLAFRQELELYIRRSLHQPNLKKHPVESNKLPAMKITAQIAIVTIPVPHFRMYNQVTIEEICFQVFRKADCFKAVPQTTNDDYKLSSLPEELVFVYTNYVVLEANNMDDETLNVIKNIILELQVQDLL